MPRPTTMSYQMALGTALASFTGLIAMFGVYPHLDGFVLLCAGLAPFLALGLYLSMKPKTAGYGIGYCIFFCTLAGPENLMQYDPSAFMNDALALVLSMFASAIAFAVLFPPSAPWLKQRLFADLRNQAVAACHAGLAGLRTRFESGARDLMYQAASRARGADRLPHCRSRAPQTSSAARAHARHAIRPAPLSPVPARSSATSRHTRTT